MGEEVFVHVHLYFDIKEGESNEGAKKRAIKETTDAFGEDVSVNLQEVFVQK
ncbi:MAG: hypothetical protein ACOCQR_03570 [bacterium]